MVDRQIDIEIDIQREIDVYRYIKTFGLVTTNQKSIIDNTHTHRGNKT